MSMYSSRSLRHKPTGGFLDGGAAPQPPAFRPRRMQRLKERRRRQRLWIGLIVVLALLTVVVVVLLKVGPAKRATVPGPVGGGPPPSSLVWAVTTTDPVTGQQVAAVALIAVPAGRPPVAVAIPDAMLVDLPGGAGPQIGSAGTTGATAMEAVQAALNRRVGHYVESSPEDIGALVTRMGGVDVTVEASFPFGATTLGPGALTMTGPEATAYLTTSTDTDRTARWEDVLAGLLAAKDEGAWHGFLGDSDDAGAVAGLLAGAGGAPVIELPTTPTADGGLEADPHQLSRLIASRLGSSVGPLTRVIVQNGTGVPGQGAAIGALLAPAGFRVVASQNATSFNEAETKIVASSSRFLGRAQDVQRLMGAGNVYVGSQPTGIADITIVVGKDFAGA